MESGTDTAAEIGVVMVKPDGVRMGLTGNIIHRFEDRGLQLIAVRMTQGTESQFTAMYYSRQVYSFWDELLAFLLSGPVVPAVFTGPDASRRIRGVLGEKDPLDSLPGTIRGSLPAMDRIHTLCHGSRKLDEATNEARIWFPEQFPGAVIPADARPGAEDPYAPDELAYHPDRDGWEGCFTIVKSEGLVRAKKSVARSGWLSWEDEGQW